MKMDQNYKSRLRRSTEGKVCPSLKKLALKFNCSDKTIKKRLESVGIYRKKRKVVLEVSKLQSITATGGREVCVVRWIY